jgi:Protein of unknown function (DUF3431)
MSHKLDIVMARYKENLSWIGYLGRNPEFRISIINDGDPLTDNVTYKNINMFKGDNLPAETTKYLLYIIHHYDHLADRVLFTQANPFDHSPDFIGLLSVYDKWAPIQNLTYRGHPPPWGPVDELYSEDSNCITHIDNYRVYEDELEDNLQGVHYKDPYIPSFLSQFTRDDILPYMFSKFGIKRGPRCPKAFGACFSVTREIIHKYPREFYINLYNWMLCEQK